MKKISLVLAAAFAMTAFAPTSHALVRELALCTTSDGVYQVSVQDNQGIGPIRKSRIGAAIKLTENNSMIASYPAEEISGPRSISFGRGGYRDTTSNGKLFLLQGPSTNFRHYSLHAQLDGNEIADDNLNCTVFGGIILQQ